MMKKLRKKINLVILFLGLVLGGLVLYSGVSLFKKLSLTDYQEVHTDSGLKVLFLKDDSLPFIQYRIFFPKAGADYDFKGQSGLSNLTTYLTEQGAGGLDSETLQEELNQLGTELHISVRRQTVSLTLDGLSWHGEKLWGLFRKIISEPHFQEEEMEILRKRFVERRLNQLDRPGFVAHSVWRQRLFPGSIGQNSGGTLNSLSTISLEDIKTFYKSQFLEGEPVLMVVGRYNEKLKKDIVSFFNENFAYQVQEYKELSISELEAEFKLLSNDSLVQAEVLLGYPLVSFPVEDPKRFLILKVADEILGGSSMSNRLFTELREKKGLTYGASSDIHFEKLYGVFRVSGATKTESVKEFLEEALAVLKKFRDKGIQPEELYRSKRSLKSTHLLRIETPENRLNQFMYYTYYLGVKPHFLENYLSILENISLEEVNQLIKEFIMSKPLQVLVYGHSSLQTQLESMEGLPSLKVISFEDQFKDELAFQAKK